MKGRGRGEGSNLPSKSPVLLQLSKQQNLDTDPKAIEQINFTGNLDKAEGATMFFIIEKAKETVLDFSKGTDKLS